MNFCGWSWPSQKMTCQAVVAKCIHWENECGGVCILSVTVVINRISHQLLRFAACAVPARKKAKETHSQQHKWATFFFFFLNPMQTQDVLAWHQPAIRLPVLSFVLLHPAHLLRWFSSGWDQERFTTFTIKDLHSGVGRQLRPLCLFLFLHKLDFAGELRC